MYHNPAPENKNGIAGRAAGLRLANLLGSGELVYRPA